MEKLKNSRPLSFLVIALVYAFCGAVGVILCIFLPFSWWLNLLIADVCATVGCFAFSILFDNASVYDPYWSVQPIVICIGYAIVYGVGAQQLLLLIAICVWGVRLTANWAYTFKGLTHQDWRYTMLAEKTGKAYPLINFIGIHLVPTLVVWGCSLPAAYSFINPAQANAGSYIFFAISFVAVLIQGVSDYQMHKFRANRRGRKFIRSGLWKHSRHPNYLGEILMWWSIGLSVLCVHAEAWYLLFGALANTLLFLFVSIPMADKRQAKKQGFERYKSETHMLLPFPKLKKK